MFFHRLTLLVLSLSLFTAATIHAQDRAVLTVFAASSLTNAFEDLARAFEAENPTITVTFNFAGSSDLAAQLNAGAPADILASANLKQMRVVQAGGRITNEPTVFAHNLLTVITPADNPAAIATLADLALPGLHLILAAPDVPVRTYTDTLLERLSQPDCYGADYAQRVLNNLVSEEPNVRQIVAKIALGEADAGLVYASDLTPEVAPQLQQIAIPAAVNPPADYFIARLDDAPNLEAAHAFLTYLLSADGQALLTRWGFIAIIPPQAEATPPATLTLTPPFRPSPCGR